MVLRAETFHRKWPSFSKPVLVGCDDGNLWVLKGLQNQRAIVNEQVVARIGALIGAPVCEVDIIELPQELCALEPQLADVAPGLGHGVRYVADTSDREGVKHTAEPGNVPRFAALQVLYTLTHAGDHQLIYSTIAPHIVYSVDHGHFFPSGPNWTVNTLAACPPVQQLDPTFAACGIAANELKVIRPVLAAATDEKLQEIVGSVPAAWGIGDAERSSMHDFLVRRRGEVLTILDLL